MYSINYLYSFKLIFNCFKNVLGRLKYNFTHKSNTFKLFYKPTMNSRGNPLKMIMQIRDLDSRLNIALFLFSI